MTRGDVRYLLPALCAAWAACFSPAQVGVPTGDAGARAPDAGPCINSCVNKQCGNDGCGGTCGTCTAPLTCNAGGLCVTLPDKCASAACGAGEACDPLDGACKCTPTSCPMNLGCSAARHCEVPDKCQRVSCDAGEVCDPTDGMCKCTGSPNQGSCPSGKICSSYLICVPDESGMACAVMDCSGETPACVVVGGVAVCECRASPDSCGLGRQCLDGACTVCVPKTCAQQGFECGTGPDGCGGTIDCGTCPAGACQPTCGGGGVPNVCGGPACCPMTCVQMGIACGPAGDGCGGLLQCGTCAAPQVCVNQACVTLGEDAGTPAGIDAGWGGRYCIWQGLNDDPANGCSSPSLCEHAWKLSCDDTTCECLRYPGHVVLKTFSRPADACSEATFKDLWTTECGFPPFGSPSCTTPASSPDAGIGYLPIGAKCASSDDCASGVCDNTGTYGRICSTWCPTDHICYCEMHCVQAVPYPNGLGCVP